MIVPDIAEVSKLDREELTGTKSSRLSDREMREHYKSMIFETRLDTLNHRQQMQGTRRTLGYVAAFLGGLAGAYAEYRLNLGIPLTMASSGMALGYGFFEYARQNFRDAYDHFSGDDRHRGYISSNRKMRKIATKVLLSLE